MSALQATPLLALYGAVGRFPGPWMARWLLKRRAAQGKEAVERLPERFGRASAPRPPGPLMWLHGASVGEALSLLPLIDKLRAARPDVTLLMTTGTRTSAALMAERLPQGVIHQMAPIDTLPAVRAFLDHWRPDLLAIAESELWPTMLRESARRGVKLALVSARLSEKSARGWAWAPRTVAALLRRFDLILPQTDAIAGRLARLGAPRDRLRVLGSLKAAAAPLPADPSHLETAQRAVGARPLWMAASTHEGEESAVITAHKALSAKAPELLTLLALRHPERADAVAAEVAAAGLRVERRRDAPAPSPDAQVFLIDRLGELGVWFRLAPLVFVGGSLFPLGGHNPLEPARLGALALHGPHVEAFELEYERLHAAEAAHRVEPTSHEPGEALAAALLSLTDDDARPTAAAEAMRARALASTESDRAVLGKLLDALAPLLPAPRSTAGGGDGA